MGRNGAGGSRRAGGYAGRRRAADWLRLVRPAFGQPGPGRCRSTLCITTISAGSASREWIHIAATICAAAICSTDARPPAVRSSAAIAATLSGRRSITASGTVMRSAARSHRSPKPAGEQGSFAEENRPETNRAETGHKRHYRTLGRGVRAPAPGRLLGSTRPTRRDGRCLLAGIFPFGLARQFGAHSGKAPKLVRRSRLQRMRRCSSRPVASLTEGLWKAY